MAREYLKVLHHLNADVTVVSRGKEKLEKLQFDFPQFSYYAGGLENYFLNHIGTHEYAINTASIEQLTITSKQLLKGGIKYLLLEKPGSLVAKELSDLRELANSLQANVWIGYNRRFYGSIRELKNMV